MTSTELKIGLSTSARPSSRVLKPPGGGHTNIFAEPEEPVIAPRPKYNQQNSSNLNACMGSTDANLIVEKLRDGSAQAKPLGVETIANGDAASATATANGQTNNHNKTVGAGNNQAGATSFGGNKTASGGEQSSRGRVPPGGFSSGGFW